MIRNNKLNYYLTAIALIFAIGLGLNGCKKKDKEFTVTFETGAGGSAVAQQIVKDGGKVTKPADPTRDGYVFDKWYKESAHTTEWNFSTDLVRGNTTLYAKWNVPPTYSIGASALTSFGALQTPYAQPAAKTVTITNTGTGSVTLTQPTATNYDIGALSTTTLAANGATATFTVRPKASLAVGTYNETITINGTNSESATVNASFMVTEAPPSVITITLQPVSRTLTEGSITGSLTVMASATEGATLSYQWYSNETNSNEGGTSLGEGARNTFFTIPTDLTAEGSPYYYYCVVSATGGATPVSSNVATITISSEHTAGTVEAKYQFSGGVWMNVDWEEIVGAVPTLDENTFTVTGGGVNISFTGVYTDGGGTGTLGFSDQWAYLYDSSGKIGFVITAIGEIEVFIGKTMSDNFTASYPEPFDFFDTKDMQDTVNGRSWWEP